MLPAVNAGTPYNVPLAVNAYDVNGNIIAGTSNYIDSTGKPFAITLSTVNSQAGGRGEAGIQGPSYITAPGQATTSLQYNGQWLDHTVITATANSSAVNMSGATATLTTIPYATEYSVGMSPSGMASGPDGNIWYVSYGDVALGKITPSGIPTTIPCASCNQPIEINQGPDGNMWVTNGNNDTTILDITTSGSLAQTYTVPDNPLGMTTGSDGNIWFTTGNSGTIGRVAPNGSVSYTTIAGGYLFGIAAGPDGNIYYLDQFNQDVGVVNVQGKVILTVPTGPQGFNNTGIVAGPDGNMWFVEASAAIIGKLSPGGNAVTPYSLAGGSYPTSITVGPDKKIWFTEFQNAAIGEITTDGTAVTIYNNANGNGIPSNAVPYFIIVGPDGNIWFSDQHTNSVGKFVL
jgi:virginiamycin B lyase